MRALGVEKNRNAATSVLTFMRKEFLTLRRNTALKFTLALFMLLSLLISLAEDEREKEVFTAYLSYGGQSDFASYLLHYAPNMIISPAKAPPVAALKKRELIVELPLEMERERGELEISIHFNSRDLDTLRLAKRTLRAQLLDYMRVDPEVEIRSIDENGVELRGDKARVREHMRPKESPKPPKGLTMVMLCTASILIVSFNLFAMLFAEEKHSKLLLAQLLSPASPLELIAGKSCFYLLLSIASASLVGLSYNPWAVSQPFFWITVSLGSICYMSIATIIVCYSKTQSSAGLISLGYLFVLGIVLLLSKDIWTFALIRSYLPETFLFELISKSFFGHPISYADTEFLSLAFIALLLFCLSFALFKRKGLYSS